MRKIKIKELLDKITPYVTKISWDRSKLILMCLVPLIIFYLDFSFVLKPQRRALRAINSQITNLNRDLQNLEADLNRMKRWGADLSIGKNKSLVSAGQTSGVIEDISRLANELGVKIFQIRPVREASTEKEAREKSADTEQYLPVLINIEVFAGYHQLGRFLAALENHSVFMEVKDLSIARRDKNLFEHEVNLVLKTYVSE